MAVSKKKIALISVGVFILSLFVVVGVIYQQLSDLEKLKEMAVERLELLTGGKASIGSAEMDFVKGLSVKFKEVTIGGTYDGKPKFHAESLWMVVKLLPLLDRRIELKKIEIEGIFLQLIRDVRGKFALERIQELIAQPASKDDFFEVLRGSLVNKLEIKGGEIRFIDLKAVARGDKPAPLQIKNVHVLIRKRFLKIPFDFLIQGEISNSQLPASIKVSGTFENPAMTWDLAGFSVDSRVQIQDLPVARLQPYLKKIIASVSDQGWISLDSHFKGSLAGDLRSFGKLKFVSQREVSGPAPGYPSVPRRAALDYDILLNKDTVKFINVKMDSQPFNFTVKGVLGKFRSKDPEVSFDINTGAFQINKSESYLPLKVLPPEYHEMVHRRFRNGTLEIESFQFKGTLSQLRKLAEKENHKLLSGRVRMKRVDWLDPLPQLQDVTGSLQLNSGDGVLKIKKARFQDHPISNAEGTIKELMYKPVVDLSLDNKIETGAFHQALIKGLEGHSFQDLVGAYSDMKGPGRVRIHLQGPLTNPTDLSLTGAVFFDDVSLYQRGIGPRIRHLKGKIDYNLNPPVSETLKEPPHPILQFDDFSGNFGKSAFSKVHGKIYLENGAPVKEMSGTYTLDAEELPRIISDLPLQYPFDVWHENTGYKRGSVQVNYRSIGNPMTPLELTEWGEIRLQDLSLQYENGFLPISNLSGSISFGKFPLRLKDVNGWYGDSPVQLEGDLTPYSPEGPEFDLVVKSPKFLPSGLHDISFLTQLKYTGYVNSELKIKGNFNELEFDHRIDFSEASYQYEDLFVKPRSVFNILEVSGRFSSKDGIDIKNLDYYLGANRVGGKANIKSLDTPEFIVDLDSRNFKTHELAAWFKPLKSNLKGLVDFKVNGRGNFNRIQDTRLKGETDLKNLEFLPENHSHVITLNAGVKFTEKTLWIRDGNLASDKSGIVFDGNYEWGARPKLDIKVSGKLLALEELLPTKGDGADLGTYLNESALFSKGACKVAFNLDALDYKLLTLKAVSGNLSVEKKKFKFSKLDVGKNGNIRGRGLFEMEGSDSLKFKGLIHAKKIPARELFDLFGDTFQNGMAGRLNALDVRVKGRGKGLKEIGKSLVVKSSFNFRSGRIDNERLKAGVFRLFGLESEEGKEELKDNFSNFERIAGSFSLVNGIAETENFIYENDQRRSSLVGKFDLNKYEMDTVLGVAPMAALDKFLTKIPVVGKIITGGDEESLVKTYFTVKGKFNDPEVKSIPFTSLTKKVVGIFQGILQTPEFILNPAREETN